MTLIAAQWLILLGACALLFALAGWVTDLIWPPNERGDR